MNADEIYHMLKIVLEKVKKEKVQWYLEGSVNLFLQGIPVQPKDIDITTDPEGLNIFRKVFQKEIVKDFYIADKKAHVLKYAINNFEIEIAVYEEEEKNSFSTIQKISWKTLLLPVQPLPQALKFYKKIGRKDKVELIEKFLLKTKRAHHQCKNYQP